MTVSSCNFLISLSKWSLSANAAWGVSRRDTVFILVSSWCKTQPEELHHRRLSYPHQRSPSMPLSAAKYVQTKKYLWVVLSDIIQLLIIHYCLFDNCWSKDPCRYVNPASPTSKDFFARVSWSRSSFGWRQRVSLDIELRIALVQQARAIFGSSVSRPTRSSEINFSCWSCLSWATCKERSRSSKYQQLQYLQCL